MRVAVVGGSLGGLACANLLARLGNEVVVFEKSEDTFEKRGACLGFVDVNMLEQVVGAKFMRNGRRASLDQGAFYYGDVWQFLYAGLPAGCVNFGRAVTTLGDDVANPTVDGEVYDMAIIADGGWSSLRAKYVDTRQPEYTGHQIIWASVDTSAVPGGLGSFDAAFGSTEASTYTAEGIYDAVVLEPPKCDGSSMYACGFFIATPEDEIVRPERGDNRQVQATRAWSQVPEWFQPLVRKLFADFADGDIVRFTEAAARKGKIAPNPVFEYAAKKTVAGRVVLVGDAAHLSTPWTAAGAHTAILDAVGLFQALSSGGTDVDRALAAYDKGGVKRANGLLRQSQACSRRLIPRRGKTAVKSPASLV